MKENCSVTKFSPDLSYFVIVPFENFAITKKKDLGNLFDWLFLPAYTLYFLEYITLSVTNRQTDCSNNL